MPPTNDGPHQVAATCPHCAEKVIIPASLAATLQIDDENGSTLRLRLKTKPVPHDCDTPGTDLFTDES